MTMRITCPSCQETFPIAAGMADDDGKRLAALFADMEPVLGRAVIGYLRLFKPAKTALRNARAITVVQQLLDLMRAGSVCRDERGGLRRPATPATWAAGIEQLLAAPGKLSLPLANHHYLRAVVFGLAEQEGAAAERAKEAGLRAGNRPVAPPAPRETKLQAQSKWLDQQLAIGAITLEQHTEKIVAARIKFGGADL
jgi:hypothetical protein